MTEQIPSEDVFHRLELIFPRVPNAYSKPSGEATKLSEILDGLYRETTRSQLQRYPLNPTDWVKRIEEGFLNQGINLQIPQDAIILEIATGNGFVSRLLAEKFPQAKVIGWDINPEAIEFCKDFNKGAELGNLEFRCSNIYNLAESFPGNVSMVVGHFAFHRFDYLYDALSQVKHSLKEGGYFFFNGFDRRHMPYNSKKIIISNVMSRLFVEVYFDLMRIRGKEEPFIEKYLTPDAGYLSQIPSGTLDKKTQYLKDIRMAIEFASDYTPSEIHSGLLFLGLTHAVVLKLTKVKIGDKEMEVPYLYTFYGRK